MPLATPYPLVRNRNKHGTTTAGDTAAMIVPNANAQIQGKSNKKYDRTATTEHSMAQGIKPNFNIVLYTFFIASGSISRPARMRIIVSENFRISAVT